MRRLSHKGFTLVELLAVIAIMGMLAVIMVPTISKVIEQNTENSFKNLENSIKSSARAYISDNRYDISLGDSCSGSNASRNIEKINDESISDSEITVEMLINKGYLKSNSGEIINPETKKSINKNSSYVKVTYNCSKKDYNYGDLKIVDND